MVGQSVGNGKPRAVGSSSMASFWYPVEVLIVGLEFIVFTMILLMVSSMFNFKFLIPRVVIAGADYSIGAPGL